MQAIDYLVIHSTDTSEAKDFGKEVIIPLHTLSKREGGYGWNRPGFDYLIPQNGELQVIIPEHSPTITDLWGISLGKNGLTGNARHLAYVGGRTLKEAWDKDTRTDAQKQTLEAIIQFYIRRFPEIIIVGFNEIPPKCDSDSPGFSVKAWLEELEVDPKHIFKL